MGITSSTDICNLALDLLNAGTVNNIESPTSATEELLNRWYDLTRQKLLREHPWNFAIKREILAASSTDPAFGYASQFPVPADFIRIAYVSTDLTTDTDTILSPENYQVEGNAILISDTFSDSTSLRLVYVSDYKTVSGFDPLFIDLLAYDLAMNIAYKVSESTTNIQRLAEIQRRRSSLAKAIDGQERPPVRLQRSKALSARRMGTTGSSHRIVF